jgi:outer membrane receptor protein involved in Fe transport
MHNSTKRSVIKLLYFMTRLTFLVTIITLTFTGVMLASGVRSQNLKEVKIAVKTKGTVLKDILANLEKGSGFSFAYSEEIGNISNITLSGKAVTLYDVLKEISQQKGLRFNQENSLIAVIKAPPAPKLPAPGKVYGRVVDNKGETLPGANIRIVELNTVAASAVDGSYSITAAPGTYTLEVSYVSFQTKRIADVEIKSGGLTKLDIVLLSASNALNAVLITSSYKKEAVAGLYATQKNAASITDGISAEQIARTPDNNMGQVMKRISGVSTLNNRYVIVRGLTERYNQGMIDGIVLPSTDMNRHNFAFDVIPVEMVSNVVVNKTATPDVSAEFAGGQVSVNTLDIPLENFTVLSIGSGFNSQTLGHDFLQAGKRGKYDFLGFDDGHRKLPPGIKSWTDPVPPDYATPQSKLFSPDAFKIYRSPGGLNQNYRFSIGRVYSLRNDQKLGFVAGLSLRNSQDTYNYQNVRGFTIYDDYPVKREANIDSANKRRNGTIYKYNTTAGAQLNAGIQGKTYKVGFKNLFSQIFNNPFNTSAGNFPDNSGGPVVRTQTGLQDPEITRILQNKLEGENNLTPGGLKLTWLGARTSVSQETRDRTRFTYGLTLDKDGKEYYQNPFVANPNITNPVYDYRIFTDTKETDYNYALNLSQPFNFLGDKSLVKAGYNGIKKRRSLSATTLNIRTEDRAYDNFNRPYEVILAPENVGTGKGQAYYLADANNGTQFDGKSTFNAGYLMMDQRFLQKIRIVYGIRAEKYDLANTQPLISDQNTSVRKVTGEKNTNYLPSVNLTYSITPKMNLRASFAKTIIRPDFRETSYFGFYDVDLDALIVGGDLTSTKIKNTDLRYEWYPSAGEIFSVSGFYKSFDKPIELVVDQDATGKTSQYRYQNQKDAVNYGLEMEFRKSLGFMGDKQWLRNLSLFGNGSIIKSKVHTLAYQGDGTIQEKNETRALFGQSPYIVNAGMSYTSPNYGLTVSYNRAGRRTYTIASNPSLTEYENGRDQMDLQLFGRFLKQKIELKLNVGNLLNSSSIYYVNGNGYTTNGEPGSSKEFKYMPFIGTDKYEKDFDDVRYRIKYGINSNLSISYKF